MTLQREPVSTFFTAVRLRVPQLMRNFLRLLEEFLVAVVAFVRLLT